MTDLAAVAVDTSFVPLPATAIELAGQHLRDILTLSFQHAAPHAALVVYDQRCDLSHVDQVAIFRLAQLIHAKAAVHHLANPDGDMELVGQQAA